LLVRWSVRGRGETAHSLYVDAASIEKILARQHSFLPQEVIVTHLTCYKTKKKKMLKNCLLRGWGWRLARP